LNRTDPLGLYSWAEFLRDAANTSAGLGDGVSVEITNGIRELTGLNDFVDQCSDAYRNASRAAMALGLGRLAYAGLAKGFPIGASSGAAASAARKRLRVLFGGGKSLRPPKQDGSTPS